MCATFCQIGMNFHLLEKAVSHLRWQYYEDRKQMFLETLKGFDICKQHNVFLHFNSHKQSFFRVMMLFANVLLQVSLRTESCMKTIIIMQSISTTDSLSIDHTYKIASNIGYLRQDKKWFCQYDSVFIVLNKGGSLQGRKL